jgi:hypothetical protein
MDDVLMQRARRALELGRLRSSLIGASVIVGLLAVLAVALPRAIDPRWLALPFAVWAFVAWRGGALARGGMLGLAAGAAGWLVPMSVLRPCCAAMSEQAMRGDCCTRPECCLEAGAMLGVVVGVLAHTHLARDRRTSATQLAAMVAMAGATLGVRCTGLFLGEALGLLGGLAVGVIVTGAARALFVRPLATP